MKGAALPAASGRKRKGTPSRGTREGRAYSASITAAFARGIDAGLIDSSPTP